MFLAGVSVGMGVPRTKLEFSYRCSWFIGLPAPRVTTGRYRCASRYLEPILHANVEIGGHLAAMNGEGGGGDYRRDELGSFMLIGGDDHDLLAGRDFVVWSTCLPLRPRPYSMWPMNRKCVRYCLIGLTDRGCTDNSLIAFESCGFEGSG